MSKVINSKSVVLIVTAITVSFISGCMVDTMPRDESEPSAETELLDVEPQPLGCERRVCSGDYVINRASDLMRLEGCTIVTDWLTIRVSDTTNLDGLECLERVGGLHIVGNDSLTDLSGLSNLRRVQGDLWIENNGALANVDGLGSLERVDGDLDIIENDALEDASGLSSLNEVGSNLNIRDNDSMSALGLDTLSSVGYGVWIVNNAQLSTCEVVSLREQLGDEFSQEDFRFGGNAECEE